MNRADRFQKPANALKRAQELIGVGHRQQALDVLQEVLSTKRSLAKDKKQQVFFEQIMTIYVEQCVHLRDGKRVKDGLHQYKSLCNTFIGSMAPLASVIRHFLQLSEEKTAQAQANFERQKEARAADESQVSDTMASRLLLEVSGEGMYGRLERQIVTPWHKFLWDSFRCVLEILRNIPKLEVLYHETARNALNFCVTFRRKTEYRRLADMLRFHLTSLQKALSSILQKANNETEEEHSDRPEPEQVNLGNPDTQATQLETRYLQLTAACDLGLWNEAFRAIEDIRTILSIRVYLDIQNETVAENRNAFIRKFTAKLAQIFRISQNNTFHAYFLLKHLDLLKADQRTPELCTTLLLATLSIELHDEHSANNTAFDTDDQVVKNTKLASLLNVSAPPSRDVLLSLLMSPDGPYDLGRHVVSELADIYDLIEKRFHPLQMCKLLKPKLDLIAAHPIFSSYLEPLSQLILIRLFQQLGQVYSKMRFSNIRELAFFYDYYNLEIIALNAVRQRLIDVRFDHQSDNVHFNCRALASDDLRTELTTLSQHLQVASNLIHPERTRTQASSRRALFQAITTSIDSEHQSKIDRIAEITRRKQEAEQAARQHAELEGQRRTEEQAKQAAQNLLLEKEQAIQLEVQRKSAKEKKQKAWKLARAATDLTPGMSVDADADLPTPQSDMDERREKIRKIREDKERIESRYKNLGVEIDHFERATRQNEAPLLEASFLAKIQQDRQHTEKQREETLRKAQADHQGMLVERDRLRRMEQHRRNYEAAILESQQAALAARQAEHEAYRAYLLSRLAAAEAAVKVEEEQRLQREAEERRVAEERAELEKIEREKREVERRMKEQELKERMEERHRAAEKQRQREEEALQKQAALFNKTPSSDAGWQTKGGPRPERAPVERWVAPSRGGSRDPRDRYEPRRDAAPRDRDQGGEGRYVPPSRRGGDRDEPPRGDRYEPPRRSGDREEPPRGDRYEPPRRSGDREEPPREPTRGGRGSGDRYEPPRRGDTGSSRGRW